MLGAILIALAVGGGVAALVLRRTGGAEPAEVRLSFPDDVVYSSRALARQQAAAAQLVAAAPVAVTAPVSSGSRAIAIVGDSIVAGGFAGKVKVPGATIRHKGWGSQQAVYIAKHAIADKIVAADLTDVVLEAGVNNVASEVVSALGGRKAALKPGSAAVDVAQLVGHVTRDLATAIRLLRAAAPAARIWVLQLPPWLGHKPYFVAGVAADAPMRAVTLGVNRWLAEQAGRPGGPDRTIDTAPLGDATGRYLPGLSKDDLHPAGKGVAAFAARVSDALTKGVDMGGPAVVGNVMTASRLDAVVVGAQVAAYDAEAGTVDFLTVVGLEVGAAFAEPHAPGVFIGADAPLWPPGWRRPTAAMIAAVAAASAKYDVPEDYIWAVIRKESNATAGLRGYKALKASYARNKDIRIPGSKITWGEKFTEDEWRALGVCQVLPFNLFGVPGILKAADPISKAFDVRTNIMAGTRVLKILYDKYGTWADAVWKYNGSKMYMREVLAFRETFLAAQQPTT